MEEFKGKSNQELKEELNNLNEMQEFLKDEIDDEDMKKEYDDNQEKIDYLTKVVSDEPISVPEPSSEPQMDETILVAETEMGKPKDIKVPEIPKDLFFADGGITKKYFVPRYVKDKISPNFLNIYIDYPTPSGVQVAYGKETMSGEQRRLGSEKAMNIAKDIVKDIKEKHRHNLEDIDYFDNERGKVTIFAVSDDFEDTNFALGGYLASAGIGAYYGAKNPKSVKKVTDPIDKAISQIGKNLTDKKYAKGGKTQNEYKVEVLIDDEIDLGTNVFANSEDEAMDKAEELIRERNSKYEDSSIDIVDVVKINAKGGETEKYQTRYLLSNYGYMGDKGTEIEVVDIKGDVVLGNPKGIMMNDFQKTRLPYEYEIKDTSVLPVLAEGGKVKTYNKYYKLDKVIDGVSYTKQGEYESKEKATIMSVRDFQGDKTKIVKEGDKYILYVNHKGLFGKGGEVETKREFIEVVNQVKEENEAFPNDMVNVMDSINAILQDRGYDEFDEYTYDVRQEILDRYEKKVLDKQGLRFAKGGKVKTYNKYYKLDKVIDGVSYTKQGEYESKEKATIMSVRDFQGDKTKIVKEGDKYILYVNHKGLFGKGGEIKVGDYVSVDAGYGMKHIGKVNSKHHMHNDRVYVDGIGDALEIKRLTKVKPPSMAKGGLLWNDIYEKYPGSKYYMARTQLQGSPVKLTIKEKTGEKTSSGRDIYKDTPIKTYVEKEGLFYEEYAKGGETASPITNYHKNFMGTLSFDLKVKGMRKPQDFIVYPITGKTNIIRIQSDKKWGEIDATTGKGILSKTGNNSWAFALDVSNRNVNKFDLTPEELEELKSKIRETSGKEVGNVIITTDNSGAELLEEGGVLDMNEVEIYEGPDDNYTIVMKGDVYGMNTQTLPNLSINMYEGDRSEYPSDISHWGKKMKFDDAPIVIKEKIEMRKEEYKEGGRIMSEKDEDIEVMERLIADEKDEDIKIELQKELDKLKNK